MLGASNFTYAEATWTQRVPDWLASHIHAFEYFGGVPTLVVPDNLKAGVTRPDRYDPDLASAYNELARHYGTAIVPARVRKPRDKAKVEAGVLLVQRWILAALRHQTFFSLVDLNQAILGLLDRLNDRPFKKMPGRDGTAAYYVRMPRLVSDLVAARAEGRHRRLLDTLARKPLLVLDDRGLNGFSDELRRDLLELVEERHDRRSIVITSPFPIDQWHDLIGDPTLADAILDRLVHKAHKITLNGASMRKTRVSPPDGDGQDA